MLVIPVIDLLRGQVVHARRGEREKYLPVESSLCKGSDATDIVSALLALHAFSHLYIADLDAIQSFGNNFNIINKLHNMFPQLQIWLDAGVSDAKSYSELASLQPCRLVVGSESLRDASLFNLPLANTAAKTAPVLSLDFIGERFRGPPDLLTSPQLWPDDVIAMTLTRVGTGAGPDIDRLAQLIAAARRVSPRKNIFAAGGVRHVEDLHQLRDMGVAGALVASALHDGRITGGELKDFAA